MTKAFISHTSGEHGGMATLVAAEPVKEVFEGKTVWEGTVSTSSI